MFQDNNYLLNLYIVPPLYINTFQDSESNIVISWTDLVFQKGLVDYRELFLSNLTPERINFLLQKIPSPVAFLLRSMINEKDSRSQFRILIDLFELMIKIYGFVSLNLHPEPMKILKERKPTIGTWLFNYLTNISCDIPADLLQDIEEIKKNSKTYKLLEDRNAFTHGSLHTKTACEQSVNEYMLYIRNLVFGKSLFNKYSLYYIESIPNMESF